MTDIQTEQRTRRVSYTQYSMYESCPLQYKLAYIDKLAPDSVSIELVFGQAMHETVQEWLELRFKDFVKSTKFDYSVVLKQKMVEDFKLRIVVDEETGEKVYPASLEELQEYYEDGKEILDHLYKYADEFFPTKDYELVGIELPLNIPLKGTLEYVGYLDIVVLDKSTNKYYIIDLKTSRAGWKWQKSDHKKVNQVLLYKLFYADHFGVPLENIVPKFIILKRKIYETPNAPFTVKRLSNFVPSHGKISLSRAKTSWDSFINECFNDEGERNTEKEYKPNPGPNECRFCPFKNDISLCSASYYLEKDK